VAPPEASHSPTVGLRLTRTVVLAGVAEKEDTGMLDRLRIHGCAAVALVTLAAAPLTIFATGHASMT